ncbi:MAG: hypothetical protein AB7O43_15400 [Hyphomicrobiaceae bacterium]
MRRHSEELTIGCERALASHVADLSTEFRKYDAADLIALIQLERYDTLRSVLQADCEDLFKSNSMTFGDHAAVVVHWDAPPAVQLAMEFRRNGIEVYYRLTLRAVEAQVEVDFVRFDQSELSESGQIALLERALRDARLMQ